MVRIGMLSLGCPRNLVDSEVMLGALSKWHNFKIVDSVADCDVAIVNTCSFIESAKSESIDAILDLTDLKKKGKIKRLVVAGCLPQRYKKELNQEFKEVDGFIGVGELGKIGDIIKDVLDNERVTSVGKPRFLYDHKFKRHRITPPHYAYIKISEGCRNRCSYCIIPQLRGSFRSRRIESVICEAKALGKISEINLVGQDTTLFGCELYGKPKICELLKRLANLKTAHWIRLLYTHPAHYTDGLIEVIRETPKVCKYLDLPIQHINDRILRAMNRKTTRAEILDVIERLRKQIPGLAIRSTLIVGFPGEGEGEFKELLEFVKDAEFERLGVFTYSNEEGTRAYKLPKQIPKKIKFERFDVIMAAQQEISRRLNERLLGGVIEVLIDEVSKNTILARSEHDAPEVDGQVFVKGESIKKSGPLKAGDFIKVRITDTLEYDLVGEEA